MHLIIANKLYSSWSMRPWLVMRAIGLDFTETVIPLRQPDSSERIREFSPSGKVPVLISGDVVVWESLAIISYLADRFPDKPVWPGRDAARAHAKSISMEMHGGFQALRQACPMNLGKRFAPRDFGENVAADVARIEEIFMTTRERFAGDGPFLFGDFCAADAMFAPVVTRLDTYQIKVRPETRAYMDAVLAYPEFVRWKREALKEPWTIHAYEEGHEVVADLRAEATA
ncbi:glutathione S-transferase [Filomicrobium insigne]|uniref:Glutathione S-transferase n=1 Tax=Filomicrobium insigne TaxID=418854 RepID=A0A1H0R0N1_9HYPH|nr:glutathione S-transferase family protein [Filomicrobium insigne]SDP23074.1 glutathione S-transferase [Filomicrobium insigne]